MQTYRVTQHQISSELAGETVILDHAGGVYYGLNEVGTIVWNVLQAGPVDFNTLKAHVMDAFDVDEATCEADLNELLTELLHEKLVETV